MSVIIRLQNLPWSANALDIRGFFRGLSIPDGGVHIVGGEMGDAFIAFSTDEDARQAMMMDCCKLKETQVRLLLSSRAEMQKVIETARQTTLSFIQLTQPQQPQPQIIIPTSTIQQQQQQPTIVTASSLSGLLAQQMVQQHKVPITTQVTTATSILNNPSIIYQNTLLHQQHLQQQTPTVLQPPSLQFVNDVHKTNLNQNDDVILVSDKDARTERRTSRDSDANRDRKSKSHSRSRSRSRDRRRSRSRDRSSRRRRDRSRSRDRERDRDNRRSTSNNNMRRRRSRSRDRSNDRDHNDLNKRGMYGKNRDNILPRRNNDFFIQKNDMKPITKPINIWDIPPSNVLSAMPVKPTTTSIIQSDKNMPIVDNSGLANRTNNNYSPSTFCNDDLSKLHKLDEKRNPSAFQLAPMSINDNTKEQDMSIVKNNNLNTCVKLTNLNMVTAYGEIRRFFQGLFIENNGIKMLNDSSGKRTGVAYVKFGKPESKRVAINKDGFLLKDKKVYIKDITDEEFDEVIDSYRPSHYNTHNYNNSNSSDDNVILINEDDNDDMDEDNDDDDNDDDDDNKNDSESNNKTNSVTNNHEMTTIVLEDVPLYTKEQDIMKIFSNYTLMDLILIKSRDYNKKSLNAYVKFHSYIDCRNIIENKNSYNIGNNNITIRYCNLIEYENAKKDYGIMNDTTNEDPVINRDPRRRSPNFSSNNNKNNSSSQDGWRNIRRNNYNNNNNRERVSRFDKPKSSNNDLGKQNDDTYSDSDDNTDCVVISNLEYKTTDRNVVEFFSDINIIPLRVHILLNKNNQPSGDCFVEFKTNSDAKRATSKNEYHLGKNLVQVQLIPRHQVDEILMSFDNDRGDDQSKSSYHSKNNSRVHSRGGSRFSGYNNYNSNNGNDSHSRQSSLNSNYRQPLLQGYNSQSSVNNDGESANIDEFGSPGCVVSMENVPYRAGVNDILDFFYGFNLSEENIMRRFNDYGKPTGDARVCFSTSDDAKHAVDSKRHCKIMNRTIFLKII